MKLKSSPLLAIIGVCYMIIEGAIQFYISSMKDVDFSSFDKVYYALDIGYIIAWVFILLFFINLYRNQK